MYDWRRFTCTFVQSYTQEKPKKSVVRYQGGKFIGGFNSSTDLVCNDAFVSSIVYNIDKFLLNSEREMLEMH